MTTPLHHRHRTAKPELTYYVSGPMRGIPAYNFPMFDSCAAWLRSEGYGAINPADHDREVEPDVESTEHYKHGDPLLKRHDDGVKRPGFHDLIGWDLREIASPHCQGIVMLPGWEKSSGAAHERYVAEACGKQVWLAHNEGSTHPDDWYMTLCDDRLLSSFTAEGLREALNPMSSVSIPNGALHDPFPNTVVRGWRQREPDTFVKDIGALRDGNTYTHPTDMGAGGQISKVQITPYETQSQRETRLRQYRVRGESALRAEDSPRIGQFQTKDSGERVAFDSGMVRDTQEGKPRYDLIPLGPLQRLAELYARGAVKYGDRNWQKANSQGELERFLGSAFRHFIQFLKGDRDEDHGTAVVWNIFAALWLEEQLSQVTSVMENDKDA